MCVWIPTKSNMVDMYTKNVSLNLYEHHHHTIVQDDEDDDAECCKYYKILDTCGMTAKIQCEICQGNIKGTYKKGKCLKGSIGLGHGGSLAISNSCIGHATHAVNITFIMLTILRTFWPVLIFLPVVICDCCDLFSALHSSHSRIMQA